MKDSIELLLADIYALDPSLKERDAEVRAMVNELLKYKPSVTVSEAFAQNLRSNYLLRKRFLRCNRKPFLHLGCAI